MIVALEGKLTEASIVEAVIEVSGLSYQVFMPITTTEKLPAIGNTVRLHTYVVYKEDAQTVYGFYDRETRDFFRLIVEKVSGVGPKIALSVLSKLSLPILKNAIANSDSALLSKCQGIGTKTAERLVVELKDKVFSKSLQGTIPKNSSAQAGLDMTFSTPVNPLHDAVSALVSLGYKPDQADKAIRKAQSKLPESSKVEELIRCALG